MTTGAAANGGRDSKDMTATAASPSSTKLINPFSSQEAYQSELSRRAHLPVSQRSKLPFQYQPATTTPFQIIDAINPDSNSVQVTELQRASP